MKDRVFFSGGASEMEDKVNSNIEKAIERTKDKEHLNFKVTE